MSGEDGARVAQARGELLLSMLGPGADAEMRLDRLTAADLRRDGALLLDALKSVGFFPGPRAVLVEDATDGLAPLVLEAMEARGQDDARLVATGTGLAARGVLRKLFESRRDAVAITLFDDPPTEADVRDMLRDAGLVRLEAAAEELLQSLAQGLSPGDFRGLLERVALHELDATAPLGAATVAALAPQAEEAEIDDLLVAVTEGQRERIGPVMARLAAQGVGPVAVAIQAIRHIRAVLAVAGDPNGAQAGLAALRPPPGGPRRQALLRAAATWRRDRIEEALRTLVELDLQLRSGGGLPDRALLERTLIRLASSKGD